LPVIHSIIERQEKQFEVLERESLQSLTEAISSRNATNQGFANIDRYLSASSLGSVFKSGRIV
jgi:hypothetical protein